MLITVLRIVKTARANERGCRAFLAKVDALCAVSEETVTNTKTVIEDYGQDEQEKRTLSDKIAESPLKGRVEELSWYADYLLSSIAS